MPDLPQFPPNSLKVGGLRSTDILESEKKATVNMFYRPLTSKVMQTATLMPDVVSGAQLGKRITLILLSPVWYLKFFTSDSGSWLRLDLADRFVQIPGPAA